jgi:hypothetical protein
VKLTGFVITRRGFWYQVAFENQKQMVTIEAPPALLLKLAHDLIERIGDDAG